VRHSGPSDTCWIQGVREKLRLNAKKRCTGTAAHGFLNAQFGFYGPGETQSMIVEGGVYAQRMGWFRWTVLKILKIEDDVIHLRICGNRFWRRPSGAMLTDLDWGIGHMPVGRSTVEGWQLVHVATQAVSDEELAGYRIWASDEGAGVWP
jgi:hypothetical protein